MQTDLKVIVVGPPKSGKTEMADILSMASKGFQGNTKPTIALRILEFVTEVEVSGLRTNISVQLWDTSGDEKYQMCWPAIAKDADGCVLVYNAHDKNAGRAAESYCKSFASKLNPKQVVIVANKIGESEGKPTRAKIPKYLEGTKIVLTNVSEGLDDFTENFAEFLASVYQQKMKRIEEEEKRLIGEAPAKKARAKKQEDENVEQNDEVNEE
ncbi:Rab-like protein 5 [Tritrichomonas foetus]|uniref:Rab-like protein 5 n=1 Tax=Tritrichomonas foetus TaxID=1144522 RepID=A0A1J4JWW0_9EUKA|nr:Rab-like protein 5 [Tritrichomonas foetus]|eukprot:OHT02022.1 Rab-like protein 5 [Tritrichomonas foetus]